MPDPTNIETLQARRRQDATLAVRASALRRMLAEFDPQNSTTTLDYIALLQRAEDVLREALYAARDVAAHPPSETGTPQEMDPEPVEEGTK